MTPRMGELADLQHVLLDIEGLIGKALVDLKWKDIENARKWLLEAMQAIDKSKSEVQAKNHKSFEYVSMVLHEGRCCC
jgi:hypothetical protein